MFPIVYRPRLLALTNADNAASLHVLEGLGFRFDRRIAWAETNEMLALYAVELSA
jgi:hypothetical protein